MNLLLVQRICGLLFFIFLRFFILLFFRLICSERRRHKRMKHLYTQVYSGLGPSTENESADTRAQNVDRLYSSGRVFFGALVLPYFIYFRCSGFGARDQLGLFLSFFLGIIFHTHTPLKQFEKRMLQQCTNINFKLIIMQ